MNDPAKEKISDIFDSHSKKYNLENDFLRTISVFWWKIQLI